MRTIAPTRRALPMRRVVAAARELQDVGLPHGIEIDAPRGFDEEYRRCTEER